MGTSPEFGFGVKKTRIQSMSPRSKALFGLLVIAQAAHSAEEYATRLFEVFLPARLISGLVSDDLALGFTVVNAAFVAFGLWCYVGPVRAGGKTGQLAAAVWVAIELANGAAHLVIAATRGAYFPGSLTAVLLLVTSGYLAVSLFADMGRGAPRTGGAV